MFWISLIYLAPWSPGCASPTPCGLGSRQLTGQWVEATDKTYWFWAHSGDDLLSDWYQIFQFCTEHTPTWVTGSAIPGGRVTPTLCGFGSRFILLTGLWGVTQLWPLVLVHLGSLSIRPIVLQFWVCVIVLPTLCGVGSRNDFFTGQLENRVLGVGSLTDCPNSCYNFAAIRQGGFHSFSHTPAALDLPICLIGLTTWCRDGEFRFLDTVLSNTLRGWLPVPKYFHWPVGSTAAADSFFGALGSRRVVCNWPFLQLAFSVELCLVRGFAAQILAVADAAWH